MLAIGGKEEDIWLLASGQEEIAGRWLSCVGLGILEGVPGRNIE